MLHLKDNEAARRSLRRRIINTLRKQTTQPTKLAEECDLVLECPQLTRPNLYFHRFASGTHLHAGNI